METDLIEILNLIYLKSVQQQISLPE